MRGLAIAALDAGQPGQAETYAKLLLTRDLGDATARLILAEAHVAQGNEAQGRAEAARAWRESDDPRLRFSAARLIAASHGRAGNTLESRFWLRRAVQAAPNEDARAAAIRDFRGQRRVSPWRADLSFGVAPVSNINNGSRSGTLRIPGLPFEFTTAEPIDGTEFSFGIDGSYRLPGADRTQANFLTAQAFTRRYRLSPDAVGALAEDFAYTALGLGVRHVRVLETRNRLRLAADVTHISYGRDPLRAVLSLSADLIRPLSDTAQLSYGGTVERQWSLTDEPDISAASLRLRYQRGLGDGRSLSLSTAIRRSRSELSTADYTGFEAGVDYVHGPMALGPTLQLAADFSARRFGFSRLSPTGERDDRSLSLSATLGFPALEYYGFTPTLTATAARSWSNISLYETDALSLRAGFRSSF